MHEGLDEQALATLNSGVSLTTQRRALPLIASVPLTDEPWEPLAEGCLLIVRGGNRLDAGCQPLQLNQAVITRAPYNIPGPE